jgi:hypothetical protein
MQNEITQLRRVEEKIPHQQHHNVGAPTYGFRECLERNQNVDNPRPRAPQFQNPNVVVIDEINDEFLKDEDQFLDPPEVNNEAPSGILESMEMDDDTMPFSEGDLV